MGQIPFEFGKVHWKHRYCHGGTLRQVRAGRGVRPLSSKEALHLVLKANRDIIGMGLRTHQRFALIHQVLKKYASRFYIRVEQVSVQGDHIHLLIRTSRRSQFQNFFRVLAGQIAQKFQLEGLFSSNSAPKISSSINQNQNKEPKVTDTPRRCNRRPGEASRGESQGQALKKTKLWRYRPFSRVIKGWKAYRRVQDYVQLNEQEARGKILYRKSRLRGLSNEEWRILWA